MRNNLNKKIVALLLGLLLAGGAAFAQDSEPAEPEAPAAPETEATELQTNVMAAMRAEPTLSEFVRLLESENLVAVLNDGGSYTVFAVTNEALAELGDSLDVAAGEGMLLSDFLWSHITEGALTSDVLAEGTSVTVMSGHELAVAAGADGLTVDGVQLGATPLVTENGVVYIIDSVFPAAAASIETLPAGPVDEDDGDNGGDDEDDGEEDDEDNGGA